MLSHTQSKPCIYRPLDIEQVHGLVKKLQRLAKEAGHAQPLMIGIDQENGEYSDLISSHYLDVV